MTDARVSRRTTDQQWKEKHMDDQPRDPRLVALVDQAFAHALAIGLIERVGIDDKGRVVYRATEKLHSASPSSGELS